LSHLSDAEKRAYVLADNKLAELAGWDREVLAIEFQSLLDLGFDLETTGFDISEIDLVLGEPAQNEGKSEPEDRLPALGAGPAISRYGDLWLLGRHRLLCSAPDLQASYDRLLESEKAKFVFSSPFPAPAKGSAAFAPQQMSDGDPSTALMATLRCLVANTETGSVHMLCADWRYQTEMLRVGNEIYSELKDLCVWTGIKNNESSLYRSEHELIYLWQNGEAPPGRNLPLQRARRPRGNVWRDVDVTIQTDNSSRAEKPVALVAQALKDMSAAGDLVLDPFADSGTVLIAAEHSDRKASAIEKSPLHADRIIERWQHYTGQSAILAATSEDFAQRRELTTSSASSLEPVG
jgi:hypothetical protein